MSTTNQGCSIRIRGGEATRPHCVEEVRLLLQYYSIPLAGWFECPLADRQVQSSIPDSVKLSTSTVHLLRGTQYKGLRRIMVVSLSQ